MSQSIQVDRRFAILDEWLLDLPVSDRAIRLYAVLARYADNATRKAYPSRETLAERLRCSKKSVDRAALELIAAGAMSKEQRHNSSVVYTLHVVQGGGQDSPGGWSPVSRGVVTDVHLTRTTELEPSKREPLKDSSSFASDELRALFDEFWDAYPLKKGKLAAAKAFEKALRVEDAAVILDGCRRFRDDPYRPHDFTPHASTWLNQGRWSDEPYRKRDSEKTNSERNLEKLRVSMELLQQRKGITDGTN